MPMESKEMEERTRERDARKPVLHQDPSLSDHVTGHVTMYDTFTVLEQNIREAYNHLYNIIIYIHGLTTVRD